MENSCKKHTARHILEELNRKLLLLGGEQKAEIRILIVESILEETEDSPLLDQGEIKQLKVLLGLDEK